MANIDPVAQNALGDLAPALAGVEAFMGFVPNSTLTMAHMPHLMLGFSMLSSAVFGADLKALAEQLTPMIPPASDSNQNLSPDLVQLIALSSSVSSGCRYCQAHTGHNAAKFGVSQEKLDALLGYRDSPHFSELERAVLDLSFAAGEVPNGSTAEHFEALRPYFSDRQIVQIVGVISLFGFLNRWNDTMATTLESVPLDFSENLSSLGWTPGKHAQDA